MTKHCELIGKGSRRDGLTAANTYERHRSKKQQRQYKQAVIEHRAEAPQ